MYGISEARRDARRHVLSTTEEAKLHAAYVAGDHVAGQRLVNSFLPALTRSAHAYGMSKEHAHDMLGVAVQAFLENLFRYDPDRNCRLWTYMRYVVKHAVSGYASANRTFFRTTSPHDKAALAFLDVEKKKLGACGRPLTGSETRHVAAVFGVPESVVHGFDNEMAIMRPGPLNGEWRAEAQAVADPDRVGGHLDFEKRHDHERTMEKLGHGLDLLDARQREVVTRRFKETPDTLQEIAEDMGVSRERIRQIEGIALRILRHAIENPGKTRMKNASLLRRYDDGGRGKSRQDGVTYVKSTRDSSKRRPAKRPRSRDDASTTRRRNAVDIGRTSTPPGGGSRSVDESDHQSVTAARAG